MTTARYFVGLVGLGVFGAAMNAAPGPWPILVAFIGGVLYGVLLWPLHARERRSTGSET